MGGRELGAELLGILNGHAQFSPLFILQIILAESC
jgi:hypothetical protein